MGGSKTLDKKQFEFEQIDVALDLYPRNGGDKNGDSFDDGGNGRWRLRRLRRRRRAESRSGAWAMGRVAVDGGRPGPRAVQRELGRIRPTVLFAESTARV
jgi:hypothetical protein